MTYSLPAPGPRLRAASRRLSLILMTGTLALSLLMTAVRPAKADSEDLLRFLAGALIVGAIVNAIDDNHTPSYQGRWVLPDACLETYRVRHTVVDAYNARCLQRAGYSGLPGYCLRTFDAYGQHRRAYVADCLYDAGYAPGGYHRPVRPTQPVIPPFVGTGDYPAIHPNPGNSRLLPARCQMTFRQNGGRLDGYWADCLHGAGLRNLPGQCLLTATDGSRLYPSYCLNDLGYRVAP